MFVRAHAASNCKEGLQRKKNHRNYYPHQLDSKKWCRILSSGNTHLSSLSRQCTRIGSIPDFIRSSMGGLRSLDSSFLCREMIKKTTKLQTNPAWKEQGVVKSSFALQKGSVLTQEQVSKGFLWSSLGAPRTEVLPKCFSPPP